MTSSPRRVRVMIMRTFVGALVSSFAIFTLIVVFFGFTLEDDIFDLQVIEAADKFLAENPHPLADSGTLAGLDMTYYIGTEAMPSWLRAEVDPSYRDRPFEVFGEEHGHFHALVKTMADGRNFYVFFNARPFVQSTPQIKGFLMVISGMAGLGFLLSLFFLSRMSRKVSAPLEEMADLLTSGESLVGQVDLSPQAPRELHTLAQAIEDRDHRIQVLLERERQFNRDASHELRTPLAVAFGATEVLEEKQKPSAALTRLKAAIKDMQQLTEGILWLSRNPEQVKSCNIKTVCADSIKAYRHLAGGRDVAVTIEGGAAVQMPVPEAVAHVMIGNILRNALSYTDSGSVNVYVRAGKVQILDTGVGFGDADTERQGFGIGLSLVERLCAHFGVSFEVAARSEGGTQAALSWSACV